MKTLLYILLLPAWILLSTGCTKPAKVSSIVIPRTEENRPVFEVNSWNCAYPENKNKSSKQEKRGSYVVTLIKYHPKHAVHTNKLPAYNSKTETIERTRVDDYWSAYLFVTESGSSNVGVKSHTKVNRSVMFFSLDSAMLTADIEALLNKERLRG